MISSNIFMLISAIFTWTWCTPVQKIWLMDLVPGTCWDHAVVVRFNTFSGGKTYSFHSILARFPLII